MAKTDVLPEKYRKALQLIEDGKLSYRSIANQCGIAERTLYDLVEGKIEKHGNYGKNFYKALQEAGKRKDKQIRELIKSNKFLSQAFLNDYLAQISQKKDRKKAIYMITKVINALAKSTPSVQIDSFTYQKGLSPEDIYNEFKRLSGLASDRRTISGSAARRTGEIPLAPGAGDRITEEPEDPILPAEPETGPIPPEPEHD